MEKQHPIDDLMSTTMQKLREIADVNTIVGKPIQAGNVTIIPISRLTVGFASGGSDFVSKNQKPEADNSFGGGSGAGMNLSPVAFLIVKGDTVKLMPVAPPAGHHRGSCGGDGARGGGQGHRLHREAAGQGPG